jgi:signal transduction histidine kinase
VNAVVVPAMALSLAWRRQRPLMVLAVVLGGYVGLSLAFGATQSWSFTFIVITALYSAVVYGTRPLLAAAMATVGVVVASLTDPLISSFGDAVWGPSLIVLTVGAGLTGRRLHARTNTLEHRAKALDREEQRRAAEAAAEERRRIARELHDIISHSLGVVVLQAGAAERVLDRDPARAREVLESIRATGQEAIGEMGTLLGLLDSSPRSSREPQPSLADLEGLVSRMRDAGLSVDLEIEGQRRELPAALELSAFRVMQEGLTNSLKHARAAHVRAVLRYREDELEVDVADDGVAGGNGVGTGRGLAGMRERVEVFGGTLEAGPQPGGGWTLHATFPVAR